MKSVKAGIRETQAPDCLRESTPLSIYTLTFCEDWAVLGRYNSFWPDGLQVVDDGLNITDKHVGERSRAALQSETLRPLAWSGDRDIRYLMWSHYPA